MARSLRLDRLMRASHAHVEATARDDTQENQILAMRLIEHINSALGAELSIADLFDAPTVADLDRQLEKGSQ